eukprot:5790968-Prymnesium_polylepis.1
MIERRCGECAWHSVCVVEDGPGVRCGSAAPDAGQAIIILIFLLYWNEVLTNGNHQPSIEATVEEHHHLLGEMDGHSTHTKEPSRKHMAVLPPHPGGKGPKDWLRDERRASKTAPSLDETLRSCLAEADIRVHQENRRVVAAEGKDAELEQQLDVETRAELRVADKTTTRAEDARHNVLGARPRFSIVIKGDHDPVKHLRCASEGLHVQKEPLLSCHGRFCNDNRERVRRRLHHIPAQDS